MKNIFLFIFLLAAFASKAQFPVQQSMGSVKTEVYSKGAFGADSGFVFRRNYPDTTTANLGYLKNIPGFLIKVGNDLWLRNTTATAWLKMNGGSSGTPNLQQVTTAGATTTNKITISPGAANGLEATATDGFAGVIGTSPSIPLWGVNNSSSTSAVVTGLNLNASPAGVGANGQGISIDYNLRPSSGGFVKAGTNYTKWADATAFNAEFEIKLLDGGVEKVGMNIQPGGTVRVNNLADTLATRAYARSVGGSGGVSAAAVAAQISDSLTAAGVRDSSYIDIEKLDGDLTIGDPLTVKAPTVVTSSSTSLTLTVTGQFLKSYYYTSASNGTWTMPAIGTTGQIIKIKNKGTGELVIQRAGSDQIFTDSLVNSIILLTGDSIELQDDGTNWSTH